MAAPVITYFPNDGDRPQNYCADPSIAQYRSRGLGLHHPSRFAHGYFFDLHSQKIMSLSLTAQISDGKPL